MPCLSANLSMPSRVRYVLISIPAALLSAGCGTASRGLCDRDCLIESADAYVDALTSQNPRSIPLASDVAVVENIQRIDVGDGLWATAVSATDYRIYVPDELEQTIGMIVVLNRRATTGVEPALLAARLKLEDGEITEIEQLVSVVPPEADPANLIRPRANILSTIPAPARMTRAELVSIASSYYEALDQSDGSLAPFAEDCERLENGMITASWQLAPASFDSVDVDGRSPPAVARDCIGQMSSRRFAYIDSIDNRRIVAVDPARGLVMGFSHFRQSMSRGPHRMIAADGTEILWDEQREPYDLPAAHIFKITDSEIHEVEAIGIFEPYGSPTGWD